MAANWLIDNICLFLQIYILLNHWWVIDIVVCVPEDTYVIYNTIINTAHFKVYIDTQAILVLYNSRIPAQLSIYELNFSKLSEVMKKTILEH